MSDEIISKQCTKCKEVKPVSEFYKHPRYKDGYRRWCKACDKADVVRWRKTPNGKVLRKQQVKKYRETDKYKRCYDHWHHSEKGLLFRQENRRKHRLEIRARRAVAQAVKHGTFPSAKQFQCTCGKQAEDWHHYTGYEGKHRWEVVPVCGSCHVMIHRLMSSNKNTESALA